MTIRPLAAADRTDPLSYRPVAGFLFIAGLAILLAAILKQVPFGGAPMQVGQSIVSAAPGQVGAANIVTAVVLAYRGLDTLGEISILFVAAMAAGLVLGHGRRGGTRDPAAGFILRTGAALLFPFLLVLGAYVIIHGHLTPGGGFQGGTVLAAAFFLPHLARPDSLFNEAAAVWVEGLSGATFIVIGLMALAGSGHFLEPLLGTGALGSLFSAGTLPLLYLAIGLKVGAELGGVLGRLAEQEAVAEDSP
jgi:multicomponent Na+:H+ antiporter subunit B